MAWPYRRYDALASSSEWLLGMPRHRHSILYTYFKFGKKEWKNKPQKHWFIPWSILGLVCCFTLQIVFIVEFGGEMASEYSAFLQNLLMSILFIDMLWKRGSLEGQSILLAVSKWLGTLAPTILMGILTYNALVLVCGIFCSLFDLLYIGMLIQKKRQMAAIKTTSYSQL